MESCGLEVGWFCGDAKDGWGCCWAGGGCDADWAVAGCWDWVAAMVWEDGGTPFVGGAAVDVAIVTRPTGVGNGEDGVGERPSEAKGGEGKAGEES